MDIGTLQTCAQCGGFTLQLRENLCLIDYRYKLAEANSFDDLPPPGPPRIVKIEQPAEGPIAITCV